MNGSAPVFPRNGNRQQGGMSSGPSSIQRIVKRDGALAPYERERIANAILKATAAAGNANAKLANAMAEKVEAALLLTYGDSAMPSVEDIQDVVESVLIENRLTRIARLYIVYRHQRAMARAARACEFQVTDHVPYKIIYETLRWNMDHRCDSIPALNRLIARNRFPELVRAADERYAREVHAAAARILDRLDRIRIVIIAGPSSSGKTTTTHKLSEKLAAAGKGFKAINIDNYFFDLDRHPRDEFGDYDYEPPQALDMTLINRHLADLLAGRTVKTPRYSFKTGIRTLDAVPLTLKRNEILLIDSLHGLHEAMTAGIPKDAIFRLYIETLGQMRAADGSFLRWADNRLLRRMLRDKDHRNLKPVQTLAHWHYVRRSELRYIIPFLKHADSIVNSALPYELPVLKSQLYRTLSAAKNRFRDDPRRRDAHIRVNRICDLLRPLKPVRNDACIPADSLLREFIGGSRYRY